MNEHQASYIYRTIDLRPDDAVRAFDRVARAAGLADGRLTLDRPGSPVAPDGALYWPLRTMSGRLQLGRRRAVPVELALSPWSATRTEVSIRPLAPRPPRGKAYASIATGIVERIGAAIEARGNDRLVAASVDEAAA